MCDFDYKDFSINKDTWVRINFEGQTPLHITGYHGTSVLPCEFCALLRCKNARLARELTELEEENARLRDIVKEQAREICKPDGPHVTNWCEQSFIPAPKKAKQQSEE